MDDNESKLEGIIDQITDGEPYTTKQDDTKRYMSIYELHEEGLNDLSGETYSQYVRKEAMAQGI